MGEIENLDEVIKQHVLKMLDKYHGNKSKVAIAIGMGRTTLYRNLARWGIK